MGILEILQQRRALGNDIGPGLTTMPLEGDMNPRNPFLDWLGQNKGRITSGFAGMVGAGNDPRMAAMGWSKGLQHGQSVDEENAIIAQEEAQKQAEIAKTQQEQNQTRAWIMKNAPQYADLPLAQALEMATKSEGTKPTSSMQEYQYAVSQGYKGTFQQYETDMKKAGATNIDFNANQGNAAGFADRMASANAIISDPKIEAAMLDLVKKGAAGIPVAGNFLVGPEFQQAEQAKRDFVNAILRRESGAVISPSEFENANQQYFPQPGDSPEVIAQKAANRQIAIEGVQRAAGPNYAAPSLTPPGVVAPQTTSTGVQWSIEP
jgi:hypothetical protein